MDISKLKPGDRVNSRCTRCNDLTSHAIIVIVDGAIHKVECCVCKGVHKYKPAISEKTKTTRRIVSKDGTKSTPKKTQKNKQLMAADKDKNNPEILRNNWQYALNNTNSEPAPYSMKRAWALSDVIEHPTFGKGVVIEIFLPDKMHVLFCDGIRLLKNGS